LTSKDDLDGVEVRHMRAAFDLDDLPASERYDYWRDVSESLHVPVSVTCDSEDRFRARWDGRYLGRIFAGRAFISEEQRVARTTRHISRSTAEPIGVWMPLSGGILMRQDGRETMSGTLIVAGVMDIGATL
jgi:hypothetical protein